MVFYVSSHFYFASKQEREDLLIFYERDVSSEKLQNPFSHV